MTKPLRAALLSTAVALCAAPAALCAAPASAHQPKADTLALDCTVLACAYDSHGTLVGLAQAASGSGSIRSTLFRPMNNTWYQIQYSQAGFDESHTVLFFTGPNCIGAAYALPEFTFGPTAEIPVVNLPLTAFLYNQALWGTVGPLQFNIPISSQFESGSCLPNSTTLPAALPAAKLDSTTFYPPFSIR